MIMNKIKTLLLTLAFGATGIAHAGTISDSYWGADGHGYGDLIGNSMYDISGAQVSYSGNYLTIKILTNFAGHAGADSWAATNGIGYGDLFLASAWTPNGADAHHSNDNAANGTKWAYGLSLDNRWSNTGGNFTLYALQGTNASDIKNSESFISCALGSQCYYRNGQAVAVDTTSKTVLNTGVTGKWTVDLNQDLIFSLDTSWTGLSSYSGLALHWGETCQNDVIEGYNAVPEPNDFALLGIGMLGLALMRRRRN
jgi:hypothetical protein